MAMGPGFLHRLAFRLQMDKFFLLNLNISERLWKCANHFVELFSNIREVWKVGV